MKVNDLERIKELKKQISDIRVRMSNYSTYSTPTIVGAITKVISAYEGIDYTYKRLEKETLDRFQQKTIPQGYIIEPTEPHGDEYATYKIKQRKGIRDYESCELPPSYYTPHRKCPYVQDFINFLYNKRVEYEITEDDEKMYDVIADSFILESKDKILNRQFKIARAQREKEEEKPFQKRIGVLYIGDWPLNL